MTDFADLGLRVRSDSVKTAGKNLDALSKQAGKAETSVNKSTKSMDKGVSTLTKSVLGLAAAWGVGALGKSLVQTAARFEDVRSIFAQMTGSTAAATTEFEKLLELGRNSSVETLKLAELQASLLATQIKLTTDEWLTLIEAAENTLVPAQTLENLAIFRQRLDQGVVSLRDLDRVADRGLPVYRILQDELGLTRRELDKLNGSADVVEKTFGALTTGLEKMFSGSAERRANNLSRLMNNFGDAVQAGADVFARGFAPQLKAAIDGITKFIDEHPAQIAALGQFTGDTLQAMLTAVQIIAANAAVLKYVGLLLLVPAGIAAATGLWKVIGWTFTKIAGAYNALKEGGKFLARMTQAASTIGGIGTGLGLGYLAGNVLGMEDVDKRIDKSVRKLEHRVARSANRLGAVTGAAFAAAATSQIEGARAVLRASTRVGWVGGVLMRYTPHFLAADVAITGVANAVDKVSEAQSDLNEYLATMDAKPLTWWDTFLLKVAKLREELGLVKSASEDLLTSLSERGDPTSVRNAGAGIQGAVGDGSAFFGGVAMAGTSPSHFEARLRELERYNRNLYENARALSKSATFWSNQTLSNAGAVRVGDPGRTGIRVSNAGSGRGPVTKFDGLEAGLNRYNSLLEARERGEAKAAEALEVAHARMDAFIDEFEGHYNPILDEARKRTSVFASTVGAAWDQAYEDVRSGTKSFKQGVRDFFDELGRDLHKKWLDHYIGTPFKAMMSRLLDDIFLALTEPRRVKGNIVNNALAAGLHVLPGGAGSGGTFAGIPNSNLGASGATSVWNANSPFPSAALGGYTGHMGGPGWDGRGGRPWMLHNDEYIVPGSAMRSMGGAPVVNVYEAPGTQASVETSPDGSQIDVTIEAVVAQSIRDGGPIRRQLEQEYHLDKRV